MTDKQSVSNQVRKRPFLFLFVAIGCAILLQAVLAYYKPEISHDETISYLSATAHQAEFDHIFAENIYPANHWVTAGEWKAWFELNRPFAFQQIGRDLAETDIHPPLYFWLLHMWVWFFGVHTWTGPTLNMLLQVVGALALFKLANSVLKDRFEAVAAVCIWAVSPAVFATVLEARQYTLLGTCTILFVWMMARLMDGERVINWRDWVLLLLITACGALTHYHFILVVAGASLVFGWKWLRRGLKRLLLVGAAVFSGYLLSILLHPQFYQSVQELSRRQALEAQYLSGGLTIIQRVYAVGNTFTGFWTAVAPIQVFLFCLFVATLIWGGLVVWKDPESVRQYKATSNLQGYELALFFVWMAGIGVTLYLTFISPIHAMSARHMSAVWPFAPFLPILLLRLVPQQDRDRLLLGLVFFVILSSPLMIWREANAAGESQSPSTATFNVDRVVADGVYQGIFPRLFLQLPDDVLIFAGTQDSLIAQPEAWLPQLDETAVYLSDLSYENTNSSRDQMMELLAQRFTVILQTNPMWDLGDEYILRPLP